MMIQEIYETILKSNIINFTIMVSVLVLIFKKFHLGNIINSISDEIKNNVLTSGEIVQKALKAYKETKKEQRNLDSKKQIIIENAESTIKNIEEKNNDEIKIKENELEISKNKTKEILLDKTKEKTVLNIQNAVCKLSTDIIKENMTDEIQFDLIKNALDEFETLGDIKY